MTRTLLCSLVASVFLAGCPVQTVTGSDAGGASAAGGDGGSGTPGSPGAPAAATGADCTITTSSAGITLCQAMSLCPNILVDPSVFAGCGFRIRGDVIDLECECQGFLCPIGTATVCSDAAALLAQQNSGEVCGHAAEGACLNERAAGAADGGGATVTNATCDTSCELGCVNDPNCIQACGC